MQKALSFDDVTCIPETCIVNSRSEVDISTTFLGAKFDIPFISANMSTVTDVEMAVTLSKLGGLPILHRFGSTKENIERVYKTLMRTKKYVGFSVGYKDWEIVCEELLKQSTLNSFKERLFCTLDVAHADSIQTRVFLEKFLEKYPNERLIIGNIATSASAISLGKLIENNQNIAFKTSISGGSNCTTRVMTGFGVPTLQATNDISPYFYTISDGGIRNSGDIVKCFVAGADMVMLGSLFAGTDEAPGNIILQNGEKYKIYRGSASFSDKKERGENGHVEGIERLVKYKGSVKDIISSLCDGLRSGISYGGGKKLFDLRKVRFAEVSQAGHVEGLPHGILK